MALHAVLGVWLRLLAVVLTLCALSSGPLCAQRFDHYWYFGNGAGIDFSSGSPMSIPGGKTATFEGVAVVSDPITHNRVFYTDGVSVWDSTHQLINIPGGLMGGRSSTQSSVIVPVPGFSRRYCIVTTAEGEGAKNRTVGMRYTVLDFNEPNIIVALNEPLLAPATEKVTAVRHCNGEDYWIIGHAWQSNAFHAYLLTSQGLNTTGVVSNVGPSTAPGGSAAGYLSASSDGRMLAMAIYSQGDSIENYAGMFSFNNATGQVSAEIPLVRFMSPYGICFSPNNSKLYVSTHDVSVQGRGSFLQFDLSSHDSATIVASRETLFVGGLLGAIEPGIDGRLYVAREGSNYLSVIPQPDALGAATNFRYNGFVLMYGTSTFGLPNVVVAVGGGAPNIVGDLDLGPDVTHCPGRSVQLHASGADRYEWMPSYGLSCTACPDPVADPEVPTTYIVTGYLGAGCILVDTIVVGIDSNLLPVHIVSGATEQLCAGAQATLDADVASEVHVRWTSPHPLVCDTCRSISVRPTQTTVYYLEGWTDAGCRGRDSVVVFVKGGELQPIIVGGSTSLCPGDTAPIHVDAPAGVRVRWTPSTGLLCDTCATTAAFPDTTTVYVAELLSEATCYARDSVTIQVVDPVRVAASLGPEVVLRPGTPAVIPLQLSGLPAGSAVREIAVALRYDTTMLRLRSVRGTGGVAGWLPSNEQNDKSAGSYSAQFTSPSGTTFDVNGEVLLAEFDSYYGGTSLVSHITLESMALRGGSCLKVDTAGVDVRLDSLCWALMRGIEMLPFGSDKIVSVVPNPAGGEVRVRVNVEEEKGIVLEAMDAAGATHRLGGGRVAPGEHELVVDIAGLASGWYRLVVRDAERPLGSRLLLVIH